MDFKDNVSLDSSMVQSAGGGGGGGRGGGIAIGGGLGLVIMLLGLVFGFNPGDVLGNTTSSGGNQPAQTSQDNTCTNSSQIKNNRECRWTAYVTSIQSYWATQFQQGQYTKVPTVTFTGSINTGCGNATSEVGPFYCGQDKRVYIDTGFADQLLQQLGARGGDAAEAYILAHEYGHHVQDLTGQLAKVNRAGQQTGETSPSVRLELQADCYAGVWFKNAQQGGDAVITGVTQDDLDRIVNAAASVGDDRIQQSSSGRVNPESWTHGSARMRQYWVTKGFTSGQPGACDTFSTNQLGQ